MIGTYAPILLFFISLFVLMEKERYQIIFLIGYFTNVVINLILKLTIKDPRPSNEKLIYEIAIYNGERLPLDIYGMPSGHAQITSFCTTFIALVTKSYVLFLSYIIISAISILERYHHNKHTIIQLLVGLLVGTTIGCIFYVVCSKKIKGKVLPKLDDNCFVL